MAGLEATLLLGLQSAAKRELVGLWRAQSASAIALLVDQGDDVKFPRAREPMEPEDPGIEWMSGCACCTGRVGLATSLARLLRRGRWSALIIEASAGARPAQLIDTLRGPDMRAELARVEVVALIDSAQLLTAPNARVQTWLAEQLGSADRVVVRAALGLPRPAREQCEQVLQTLCRFEPRVEWWLPGIPAPRRSGGITDPESPRASLLALAQEPARWHWCWHAPSDWIFDRQSVKGALDSWRENSDARARGAFRTEREWYEWLDGHWAPTQWRRDSRVQIGFSARDIARLRGELESLADRLARCRAPVRL